MVNVQYGLLKDRIFLICCLIVAAMLRAHRLAAQSLWSDEDITLDRSELAFGELLAGLPVEQAPAYYVGMGLWTSLLGDDNDLILRYPSYLAGILTVVLAAQVGRRLFRPLAGPLAWRCLTLITVFSPFLIYYSQEARAYSILTCLAMAMVYAALRFSSGAASIETSAAQSPSQHQTTTRRLRRIAALGTIIALALYTHYYAVLIVAAIGVWAILDLAESKGRTREWLLLIALAGLLFAPWMPRLLAAAISFGGWREGLTLRQAPLHSWTVWTAGPTAGEPAGLWIGLLYALFFLIGSAVTIRALPKPGEASSRALRLLVLAWAPLLLYGLILLRTAEIDEKGRWLVDYDPRYFAACLPGLFALISMGLNTSIQVLMGRLPLGGRRGSAGADATKGLRSSTWLAGLIVLGLAGPPLYKHYLDPAYQRQDYREFLLLIEKAAGDEDTVLFLDGPGYGLVRRYERDRSPVKIVNWQSSKNKEERSEAERRAYFEELRSEYPHLWLAYLPVEGQAPGEIKNWLDASCAPVFSQGFQAIAVERYLVSASAQREAGDSDPGSDSLADPASNSAPSISAAFQDGPAKIPGLVSQVLVRFDIPTPPDQEIATSPDPDVNQPPRFGDDSVIPLLIEWKADGDGEPGLEHRVSVRLHSVVQEVDMPLDDLELAPPLTTADRRPVNWTRPTSSWQAGETILDRHGVWIPPRTPAGDYLVRIVVYEEESLKERGRWSALIRIEDEAKAD